MVGHWDTDMRDYRFIAGVDWSSGSDENVMTIFDTQTRQQVFRTTLPPQLTAQDLKRWRADHADVLREYPTLFVDENTAEFLS